MTTFPTVVCDDLISLHHGQPMTTSINVAEVFGKLHRNVLRKLEMLDCSPEFTELNFERSEYTDKTGRKLPVWNMTKDGFIFLVMGFTGAEAAAIKERYIAAFNKMESALHKAVPLDPDKTVITQAEYVDLLKTRIAYLEQQLRPSRPRLTESEKQRIDELKRAGLSNTQIAERLLRPCETIRTYLRKGDRK